MINVADFARRFPSVILRNLPFGFECGDGWAEIIHEFFSAAHKALNDGKGTLHVLQVKEKMGALRISFRTAGLSQEAQRSIDEAYGLAEARSFHVCEQCGRRGRLCCNGMWYGTLCAEHAAEADADPVFRDSGLAFRIVVGNSIALYDPRSDPFMSTRSD
ncbi:hypothetical protein [Rhizobium sp. PL01]|uniref:hypothetical protein n=1 Tax=Rhizobium sp. PL01 TaxID=3085631 RepID=UPI0029824245|nr:hypothetical protein [Rhizobium sp. PL01]MDW5312999.1 hypothetical protein [Rhizobium sp. PL01]